MRGLIDVLNEAPFAIAGQPSDGEHVPAAAVAAIDARSGVGAAAAAS